MSSVDQAKQVTQFGSNPNATDQLPHSPPLCWSQPHHDVYCYLIMIICIYTLDTDHLNSFLNEFDTIVSIKLLPVTFCLTDLSQT